MLPLVALEGLPLTPVGLSLGWIVSVWFVVALLRGRLLHVNVHDQRIKQLEADHAREVERVEHDRQEWRAESRIKDAQLAEKDIQLNAQSAGLSAMADLGRTVEQVVLAVRQIAGGGSP